jgi:hypothetical protein
MTGKKVDQFSSFEEFEREFMPQRHASRHVESEWTTDHLAARLTDASVRGVRDALQRSSVSSA